MRVCIYSAIYGRKDLLIEQPEQSIPTDFILFTDFSEFTSMTWDLHFRGGKYESSNKSAKMYKIFPEKYLPEQYDITIWIDGNLKIKTDSFSSTIARYLSKSPILMLKHPDRDCIYDEVHAIDKHHKRQGQPTHEQVEFYKKQGMPESQGMYWGGVIARKWGQNVRLQDLWWREMLTHTLRDQLSLPYILWKHDLKVAKLNLNQWDNPLIEWRKHHSM